MWRLVSHAATGMVVVVVLLAIISGVDFLAKQIFHNMWVWAPTLALLGLGSVVLHRVAESRI